MPKQFLPLAGVPLVERCLTLFHAHPAVDDLVLTLPAAEVQRLAPALRGRFPKLVAVIAGGAERQQSVAAALDLPLAADALVAIHDAARPLFDPAELDPLLAAADRDGAAAPAVVIADTVAEVDDHDHIRAYPDRHRLRAIQTPQIFRFGVVRAAHARARAAGDCYSDDTQIATAAGQPVTLLRGCATNLKITTRADLALASALLATLGGGAMMRIGHGFDLHRLVPDRPLWLGALVIPFDRGLLGHSDGDVVCHAIADALLGAAGLADIGHLFPDTDPAITGIAGAEILRRTAARIAAAGWAITNLDATVIAEAPRLAPHIEAMRSAIAAALGLDPSRVGVKATTSEGLGATGSGDAIAAHAVALLHATSFHG